MMKPAELIRAISASCGFAARGIGFAARSQRNFQIQLAAAIGVLAAGLAMGLSRVELAVLVLTCGLVLMGELINTGIEFLMNLLEARHHPTVKAVKDVVAGAVFLATLSSLLIGGILFGPRLAVWVRR